MKVLIFGATGMVGRGVLRECLFNPAVETVQTVGRTPTGLAYPKLREIAVPDLFDFTAVESELCDFDACFFCLGVSSSGMGEEEYELLTYGLALAAAELLCRLNPDMTFVYVSGAGTDSTERGPRMWARVKGKTENALLGLPFKAAYMFRPGIIQPLHGIKSKTDSYRILYSLMKPFLPVMRAMFPHYILTTDQVGRAMIKVAQKGPARRVLETTDIYHLAA